MSNQTPGNPFGFLSNETDPAGNQRGEPVGLLGDRYMVLEVRRGGMGEVYICESTSRDGPRVALKTFQKRLFFDRASREAFAREVSLWARLTGLPHIMPVLGLEQLSGQLFVLMPAVEPGPLGEITVRDLLELGPLPWELILSLAFQMALGLRSAQDHIPRLVHGDLKPENLLLIGGALFISDFGLALVVTTEEPELQLESTWAYRAPECWDTPENVSPSRDMYSFGVVLFELLTGKTPFQATTHDGWSRVHREEQAHPPINFPLEGVEARLMSLALLCLRKRPEDRPQSFGHVLTELMQIAHDYDDLEGFEMLFDSAHLKYSFEELQKQLRPELIRILIKLDMYELALTEIEEVPKEFFNGELCLLHGTVLSLNGRDEEALSAFEEALRSDLSEDRRYFCLSEYALSLKRLGRFHEAIDIYNELLAHVPDHMLAQVLSNLGTVYYMSRQLEEAVRCLRILTREHPELPEGWANLGLSYRDLGRYEEAVRCFQRAQALAPNMASVQVMLGEVYMDHLGRFEEAATAFELAWGQGYSSHDWFVRFLACNLLLGRNEIVAQLAAGARRDLTQAELSDLEIEIQQLIQKITGPKSAEPQLQANPVQTSARTEETTEEAGKPNFSSHRKNRSVPKRRRLTQLFRSLGARRNQRLGLDQKLIMPHLNTRFYLDEGLYSIDFYDDPAAPDYVEQFLKAWRQVTRDPRIRSGGNFTLRTTPFYFTVCPSCSIPILTNRDHGEALACQRCEATHETFVMEREDLDELLDSVLAGLGKQLVDIAGHVLVLLFQLQDEGQVGMMESICRRAGFNPMPKEDATAINLFLDGVERGLLAWDQPYFAWQKVSNSEYRVYADQTPPEVEQVLREMRAQVRGIHSVSTIYDPTDVSLMGLSLRGEKEVVEAHLRQELQTDLSNKNSLMGLIETLIARGKLEEAHEKALVATRYHGDDAQSWAVLGRVERRRGRLKAAAEALEKALAINPVDRHSTFLLAHCYQELGDTDKAAALIARSQGLGGIE